MSNKTFWIIPIFLHNSYSSTTMVFTLQSYKSTSNTSWIGCLDFRLPFKQISISVTRLGQIRYWLYSLNKVCIPGAPNLAPISRQACCFFIPSLYALQDVSHRHRNCLTSSTSPSSVHCSSTWVWSRTSNSLRSWDVEASAPLFLLLICPPEPSTIIWFFLYSS